MNAIRVSSERKRVFRAVFAVLALAALVLSPMGAEARNRNKKRSASVATASVAPTVETGNPSCGDIGAGTRELKVEPPVDGTYTDGTLTVTLNFTPDSPQQPISFNWVANIGVDAVIVKGGPDSNVYTYNPEATSDTNLVAPLNASTPAPDDTHEISHVSFCYDPPENCTNGVDDDGDGLVDGNDPDCQTPVEICGNGVDDDGDGVTDGPNCPEGPPGDPSCSDTFDNDGDGLIDGNDPNCQTPVETCGDGIDNDGDGVIDGPNCPEGPPGDPSCIDGFDNDGDGLIDAADPDCQTASPVTGGPGGGGGGTPGGGTPGSPGTPGGQPGEADPCNNPTIVGTPLDDFIKGTRGIDIIDGLAGNDRIRGKKGNDIICGGEGNDKIRGGRGSDLLFGEGTDDKLRGGRGSEVLDGGPGTDRCRVGPGKGSETRNCERLK